MKSTQRILLSRLSAVLMLLLFSLCLSGCKQKMAGTFVGRTELQTTSYDTGSFAQNTLKNDNVIAALAPGRTSSQFLLSFDEKSGLKCTLDVSNRNLEDSNTQNDDELNARIMNKNGESCEVRDKNGTVHNAKVTGGSGGTFITEGAHTTFNIELKAEGSQTGYKFSFDGNRK